MKFLLTIPALLLMSNIGFTNTSVESEYNCFDFESSCGITGTMCVHEDDSAEEVADDAEAFDEYICG